MEEYNYTDAEINREQRERDVDQYLMINRKYFPEENIMTLKEALMKAPDSRYENAKVLSYKDSTTTLLLSIFLGGYGVDRFYIGDTGMGVLKLLLLNWCTCGIFPLVDIFLSYKKTKVKNFEAIMAVL